MTPTQVQELSAKYHVRPTKALGQNFLVDDAVVAKIVAAGQITSTDTVIEIGPGFGALTQHLIATGAQVIAIEKDKRLAQYLEDTYGSEQNFTLYNEDALQSPVAERCNNSPYILMGNLPYSVTSPLLAHWLEQGPRPTRTVVMVQKEVADRMKSTPPHMSMLGLSMQTLATISRVLVTSSQSFWPQPEIDSEVVALAMKPTNPDEFSVLQRIAKTAFAQKRKQLAPVLAKASTLNLGDKARITTALEKLGLPATARPQELSVEQWHQFVLYLGQ